MAQTMTIVPSNKDLTPQHITLEPNENKTVDLSSLILNPSTEKSSLSSLPEAGSRRHLCFNW